MTDRMKKLQECLQIAIDKGNAFMAENIRATMREEEARPNYLKTAASWETEA